MTLEAKNYPYCSEFYILEKTGRRSRENKPRRGD